MRKLLGDVRAAATKANDAYGTSREDFFTIGAQKALP
jgi:hypothetical protein